jgi:hypothetical protein
MVVQVVEPQETVQEMEVRLLDWELRVKVLPVDQLSN